MVNVLCQCSDSQTPVCLQTLFVCEVFKLALRLFFEDRNSYRKCLLLSFNTISFRRFPVIIMRYSSLMQSLSYGEQGREKMHD